MNVNPIVINALSGLGLPVSPDKYTGTKEEYIVFSYTSERDELYAGNKPIASVTYIRVHYYTKGSPMAKKYQIKELLMSRGFTVTDIGQLYENDTGYTHVFYETWIIDKE